MNEHTTNTVYEPPTLIELGEFNEDTLGGNGDMDESYGYFRDLSLDPG